VRTERFTLEYPVAVLGRLFVANYIDVKDARLVTIDSDMIVNASLRPLVNRDLGQHFLAAIHDPPRTDDQTYFNTGLMMFDVENFKLFDIASRCLTWLSEQKEQPTFPDQDALNNIVDGNFHRLARIWNYFCYNTAGFTLEDYETCKVAHFAGPKPWNDVSHPGAPLYNRYLNLLYARGERAGLRMPSGS
jgi:lipopolysaccharide biosynthesis glycosyltransferase